MLTGGTGTHKGCPYGWIMRARTRGEGTHEGCRYGWILRARTRGGRGTHEGCPYGWIMRARTRGEGTHEGCPYGWIMGAAHTGGGEGTHKGCPYGWIMGAAHTGGRARSRGEGRAPTRGAPTGGYWGLAHGGRGHPQGVPLRVDNDIAHGGTARYWLAAATLAEPHCWDEGVRLVSDGFGGGRCGGCPPAQGRAEGPTAQKGRSPWRRQTPAAASPEPP